MNARSFLFLATVVVIPAASTLLSLNEANAERFSNRLEQSETVAQRPQLTPEERKTKHAQRAARLKQELSLSDEQAQNIRAIRESYKPQMQSLRQQPNAKQERQALRMKMYEEIKAELTPDQVQKLEALRAQRKNRGHRNREAAQNSAS
ncbi:MAG: Spy/CpxP family protein refolding chaperone [Cyanobacteria bacterium P01_A01_bin.17]